MQVTKPGTENRLLPEGFDVADETEQSPYRRKGNNCPIQMNTMQCEVRKEVFGG